MGPQPETLENWLQARGLVWNEIVRTMRLSGHVTIPLRILNGGVRWTAERLGN